MIEAARTARFIALTNCFVRRKGGEGGWVGLFVLSWLRQFQREIAIQVSRARSGNGSLKRKRKRKKCLRLFYWQAPYYLGRLSHGYLGLGACVAKKKLLFNRAKAGVGVAGVGRLVFRYSYLGGGWRVSLITKKILRPSVSILH